MASDSEPLIENRDDRQDQLIEHESNSFDVDVGVDGHYTNNERISNQPLTEPEDFNESLNFSNDQQVIEVGTTSEGPLNGVGSRPYTELETAELLLAGESLNKNSPHDQTLNFRFEESGKLNAASPELINMNSELYEQTNVSESDKNKVCNIPDNEEDKITTLPPECFSLESHNEELDNTLDLLTRGSESRVAQDSMVDDMDCQEIQEVQEYHSEIDEMVCDGLEMESESVIERALEEAKSGKMGHDQVNDTILLLNEATVREPNFLNLTNDAALEKDLDPATNLDASSHAILTGSTTKETILTTINESASPEQTPDQPNVKNNHNVHDLFNEEELDGHAIDEIGEMSSITLEHRNVGFRDHAASEESEKLSMYVNLSAENSPSKSSGHGCEINNFNLQEADDILDTRDSKDFEDSSDGIKVIVDLKKNNFCNKLENEQRISPLDKGTPISEIDDPYSQNLAQSEISDHINDSGLSNENSEKTEEAGNLSELKDQDGEDLGAHRVDDVLIEKMGKVEIIDITHRKTSVTFKEVEEIQPDIDFIHSENVDEVGEIISKTAIAEGMAILSEGE